MSSWLHTYLYSKQFVEFSFEFVTYEKVNEKIHGRVEHNGNIVHSFQNLNAIWIIKTLVSCIFAVNIVFIVGPFVDVDPYAKNMTEKEQNDNTDQNSTDIVLFSSEISTRSRIETKRNIFSVKSFSRKNFFRENWFHGKIVNDWTP